MAELYINGADAWEQYHAKMVEGFLDTLEAPLALKTYITNEVRGEHGERIVIGDRKFMARDVTLSFRIHGQGATLKDRQDDFQARKKSLLDAFYAGEIVLSVPQSSSDIYHLFYRGDSSTYAHNHDRSIGTISVKFREPNPSNRE